MKILVINPGSTSTKIAVFENESRIWSKNIFHSADELSEFKEIDEQYEWRKDLILESLKEQGIELSFDAVMARGGIVNPLSGGVYAIDCDVIHDLWNSRMKHACNLAGIIAHDIAEMCGCPSFMADPVVTDELYDIARLTGIPEIKRISLFHALNSRAVARKYASDIRRRYEDLKLVVVHMGGGISISAHYKGRVVDVNNALDGEGPFAPERAGSLPARGLVDLCFEGKYSHAELCKLLSGKGGLFAYFGTTDVRKIVDEIKSGNQEYKKVIDAMIYNIAKFVGSMHVALMAETDAIIITGGIAYSEYIVCELSKWIKPLADIVVMPGEDEMQALAMNAVGALTGKMEIQKYKP